MTWILVLRSENNIRSLLAPNNSTYERWNPLLIKLGNSLDLLQRWGGSGSVVFKYQSPWGQTANRPHQVMAVDGIVLEEPSDDRIFLKSFVLTHSCRLSIERMEGEKMEIMRWQEGERGRGRTEE